MRILFFDPSIDKVPSKELPMNGRTTALAYLCQELSKLGVDVYVVVNIDASEDAWEGRWISFSEGMDEVLALTFDSLIFFRGVYDGIPEIRARRRIFCPRDLPHAGFIKDKSVLHGFCRVVHLSNYSCFVWESFYPELANLESDIIQNGVDKNVFHPLDGSSDNVLIFASNPNRGLHRLPVIAEAIASKIDSIKVLAFSRHNKLHPNEKSQIDTEDAYRRCIESPYVSLVDLVGQEELAVYLSRAKIMLLPSDYPEICSNVMLQSLACGTPVVTSLRLGSAREFISGSSLIDHHPHDGDVYLLTFVRRCIDLLQRRHLYMSSMVAINRLSSWEDIAQRWLSII